MPKDYAKRFADFIAGEPDVASDYTIQLHDLAFAHEVATELHKLGFETKIGRNGLLSVHVPDHHPRATERKSSTTFKWPRKPDDRTSQWARLWPVKLTCCRQLSA